MPTVAGVERAAYRPETVDSTTLDTVKGTAFFENIDPTAIAACIHQPGHRMIWETRIKQVAIIERFNQVEFLFYIIFRGIGPIYWPRDAVGIQASRFFRPNGELVTDHFVAQANRVDMMWCSLENPPIAPQEGKVRARIFAGYKVEARGNGCQVNFFVSLHLSTPIPACKSPAKSRSKEQRSDEADMISSDIFRGHRSPKSTRERDPAVVGSFPRCCSDIRHCTVHHR